jgi:hypothetical protein
MIKIGKIDYIIKTNSEEVLNLSDSKSVMDTISKAIGKDRKKIPGKTDIYCNGDEIEIPDNTTEIITIDIVDKNKNSLGEILFTKENNNEIYLENIKIFEHQSLGIGTLSLTWFCKWIKKKGFIKLEGLVEGGVDFEKRKEFYTKRNCQLSINSQGKTIFSKNL